MTLPRLIPSTMAWRLTLSFDVRSIIFLRSTLTHAGMCCRATGQQTCLAERAGQKIMSQRQLPDLGMKGRRVDGWFRIRLGRGPEHACGAFKKLITPLLDLIGAPIKVLSQLDQGLFPLDRSNGHLCLECRTVIPARSSRHGLLPARGNHAAVARKIHLSQLFRFPERPLTRLGLSG
jgi:hypothetical protein